MSKSALSTVVSELVRASLDAATSSAVTEEELDRHVAELILQEAKQKEQKYGSVGITAYLPEEESNVPRPNKRFLSTVVKHTEDHNKAVLKAQAQAASEAKVRQDEKDRQIRKVRASEAADSRRRPRGSDDEVWDVWTSEDRRSHKGKARADEDRTRSKHRRSSRGRRSESPSSRHSHRHHRSSRHRPESRSPERGTGSPRHSRRRSKETNEESRSSHKSRRRGDSVEGLRSTKRSSDSRDEQEVALESRSLSERNSITPSEDHPVVTRKPMFKPITRPRSPTPPEPPPGDVTPDLGPSRSPSPLPKLSSKMDRYFTETYDPRLDTIPLSKAPRVPKDGLIPDEEFEGWEAMLELIKLRRQDKHDRKRTSYLDAEDDGRKKKKRKKDEKKPELPWQAVEKKREILNSQEPGLMDIRYQRRGTTREWDLGKAEVT